MTARDATNGKGPLHTLFLVNAIFVAVVSLPLIFFYPAVFARLGVPSLENGFFVQLAGAWLFTEAIASAFVWLRPRQNVDTVWVIVAMKAVFILLVVVAMLSGTLPATAFLVGAVIDLLFSIAFVSYVRGKAG